MNNKSILFYALIITVVAAFIPLAVYHFVHLPAIFAGAGDENTWVAFWGCYAGSIITALISMIILSKQLKNTKDTTIYQTSLQELTSIKDACVAFLNSMNTDVVVDVTNKLLSSECKAAHELLVRQYDIIHDSINKLQLYIETWNTDELTKNYNEECHDCIDNYSKILNELQLLISFVCTNADVVSYTLSAVAKIMVNNPNEYLKSSIDVYSKSREPISKETYIGKICDIAKARMQWLDSQYYEKDFRKHLVVITGNYLKEKRRNIDANFKKGSDR